MSLPHVFRSPAPRLIFRILGFSMGVIAALLVAVFVLLSWQTRERLTRAIVSNQEASQRRFADLAVRRQREQRRDAATLAENPTLKAAIDTYHSEIQHGGPPVALAATIQSELTKLQGTLGVPALTVTDVGGVILTSAGPLASDWPAGERVPARLDAADRPAEAVITRHGRVYLATVTPLLFGDDLIGEFFLAEPLDAAYVHELSAEAGANVAVLVGGHVVATTAPVEVARALEGAASLTSGSMRIGRDEFVVGKLWTVDAATVYVVDSASDAIRAATSEALVVLSVIGGGALLLAGLGSWWLARTLANPIGGLTRTLAQMARERDFERPLVPTGGSREVDELLATFDELRQAVADAEAESEAAYVGVIGSLAAALDARDPYTAGHSERVANLSVAIARQLELTELEIETVRLGALLHDIGKIGVSDAVLRKPGKLSAEEFAQIKLHPTLGARILKPLRFLAGHLPVVELHHEQPDGGGYPHGLLGVQIPLLASIVHVADAFDAMTSARAYRPSRPVEEAMAELWRHADTQFVQEVVEALAALPLTALMRSQEAAAHATMGDEGASVRGALIQFRARTSASARAHRAAAG
jgi:putative nucleotidyltransferase with HDIG domain